MAEKKKKNGPQRFSITERFVDGQGFVLTIRLAEKAGNDWRVFSMKAKGKGKENRQRSKVERYLTKEQAEKVLEGYVAKSLELGWERLDRQQKFDYEGIPAPSMVRLSSTTPRNSKGKEKEATAQA